MYIQLQSGGTLHIKKEGERRTVCGRDYARYDYLPVSEEEFNPNRQSVCYKCRNAQREYPRTIKEAFTPERMLG